MAKGFERLKSDKKESFFRLYREFVGYAIDQLTDQEFKLWICLLTSAHDFGEKSKGKLEVTLSQIKSRFIWSQGKTSYTLNGLLKKNFAKRIKRGLYHFPQTLSEVQSLELTKDRNVQDNERKVQSDEHFVRNNEFPRHDSLSYKDNLSSSVIVSKETKEDLAEDVEEILGAADFEEKI